MRIGLIVQYLDEEYQTSVYRGVEREASRIGMDLVCIQGETFDIGRFPETDLFPSCAFLPLDGILLLSSILTDHRVPGLSERLHSSFGAVPVVSVGAELAGFYSVLVDSDQALRELVSHLVRAHGYRRFLYLGGPVANRDNEARESVIHSEFGRPALIGMGCSLTVRNGAVFSDNSGTKLIMDYIQAHPTRDVDVIVAGSDDMAAGILKYLKTCSLPSWMDCPVTGFDDIPLASLHSLALTTIHQPLEELGAEAVGSLAALIRKERLPLRKSIPAWPVMRNSCGCESFKPSLASGISDTALFREQMLRAVTYFGQELMMASSLREILAPLTEFLAGVSAKSFSLVLFDETTRGLPPKGRLCYEYRSLCETIYGEDSEPVDIRACLALALERDHAAHVPHCLFHLRSGEGRLGLVLFSVDDSANPYMSSCCVFLAHALKRLEGLAREKTRARDLEDEVLRRTAELESESARRMEVEAQVLRISDLERMRFSIDLHDDICQRLAAMTMVCKNFAPGDPNMQMLLEMSSGTLARTRQYAHDSFPVELDSMDFRESLYQLCCSLDGKNGCAFAFSCPEAADSWFNREQKINLYRIVQESLHNVIAHSRAVECSVELFMQGGMIFLRVQDNGSGNPEIGKAEFVQSDGRRPRGLGLRSMEYRAHQLGAEFMVSSAKGKGTFIEVRLPSAVHHE